MSVGPIPKGVPPLAVARAEHSTCRGISVSRLDIITVVVDGRAAHRPRRSSCNRTMLGVQLRASTEDFDMARLVGVRANRVIVAAFAITGLLAGVVAFLLRVAQRLGVADDGRRAAARGLRRRGDRRPRRASRARPWAASCSARRRRRCRRRCRPTGRATPSCSRSARVIAILVLRPRGLIRARATCGWPDGAPRARRPHRLGAGRPVRAAVAAWTRRGQPPSAPSTSGHAEPAGDRGARDRAADLQRQLGRSSPSATSRSWRSAPTRRRC